MDQIDLIIAYLVDIEEKQRFKDEYSDINVVDVRLEHLNTIGRVLNLFEALRLEPTSKPLICYVPQGKSTFQEKAVLGARKISLDYCENR